MSDWRLYRGWRATDETTFPALRQCLEWQGDRATGWLCLPDRPPHVTWPGPLAATGPRLLAGLAADTGVTFTACCYQAYRDGAGCGWHHDRDWGAQAVLSLGVTRTFGLRREGGVVETHVRLGHGDLLVMPAEFGDSWEHCLLEEDVPGERCSLVFRATR